MTDLMVEEPQSEFDESYQDPIDVRGEIFNESLGAVPRRPSLSIAAETSVAAAITAMNEKHVGCALVVKGERLAGIFTERDVLRKVVLSRFDLHKTTVAEVMTRNPETLPSSASVGYALRKMSVEGYRHIPLVDDEHPVGVVAVRDIVAWLVELVPQSVLNLGPVPGHPTHIDGG